MWLIYFQTHCRIYELHFLGLIFHDPNVLLEVSGHKGPSQVQTMILTRYDWKTRVSSCQIQFHHSSICFLAKASGEVNCADFIGELQSTCIIYIHPFIMITLKLY